MHTHTQLTCQCVHVHAFPVLRCRAERAVSFLRHKRKTVAIMNSPPV
jgi:hypothetical protein